MARRDGAAWLFQRFSGLILLVLILLHLQLVLAPPAGPGRFTFIGLSMRMEGLAFVAIDLAVLALALFHTANGLRGMLIDFNLKDESRARYSRMVNGLCGLFFLLGAWVLLPFLLR